MKRRLSYNLPEVQIGWAEFKDGETIGGPVFVCRPGGCARFRRICGQSPENGGPTQYCTLREARIATLRRFMDVVRDWYEKE